MKQKIETLPKYSAILCSMVVLIHISIPHYFDYGGSDLEKACHFLLKEVVSRFTSIAVPSFFVLSAFLFYRNFSLGKLKEKLKSRFYTLVVPYLLWNTIGLLVEMIICVSPAQKLATYHSNPFSVVNILSGIFLHKYTILWFIFALVIYTYLCPIIYYVVRNKIIGLLALITSVCVLSYSGFDIKLPNGSYFETSSVCYYLAGAFLGCHYKDFYNKHYNKVAAIVSAICMGSIVFLEVRQLLPTQLGIGLLLLKSYLFGIIVSSISTSVKMRDWFGMTFFIYASQLTVSRFVTSISRLLVEKLLPSLPCKEILLYLVSFIVVMAICITIAKCMQRCLPKIYVILTGNRI